jgi:gliding motility-associated-like protein
VVLDEKIIVPNVITPNGDGKDDYFAISGLNYYPNSKLSIYDRWGKEVYTSNNYQNDWNGGGQSDGVYYYLLSLQNGKKYKGYFQIIK